MHSASHFNGPAVVAPLPLAGRGRGWGQVAPAVVAAPTPSLAPQGGGESASVNLIALKGES
jgi:hypothetical protein